MSAAAPTRSPTASPKCDGADRPHIRAACAEPDNRAAREAMMLGATARDGVLEPSVCWCTA